jgi:outer membrane lipoprotein LolB
MNRAVCARRVRWLAVMGLVAVLAACAAPARIGGRGPAFERVGRFAVNLQPVAQPPYAAQGGFSWRDDGRTLRLDLSTPLGSVLARIQVEPGRSVLERADGSHEAAASPDALLALVWGHAMPVSGLRSWIRGQPVQGRPVSGERRDGAGHLVSLEQDGWQVLLSDYDREGPRRVRLLREDAQGQWRLQLVVDRG